MKERLLAAAGPLLGLALFVLAALILQHELAEYHYHDVLAHLNAIETGQIALALAFTALGYLSLTGYDALAFRWIGSPLGYPRIALASFIAYVFSHNVGLSFFGGSAVRYRMFTTWGVTPSQLARAISFNVITFWLGFLALAGVVLLADPIQLPGEWLPPITTFAAGVILLLSGATPATPGRVELLDRLLPLPVVEMSHLLGSLTGVALLLLARALQQRVDAGYALTLALLAGGAAFSLGKGLDWEEASILAAMFLALLPCRRFFYRRSSLLAQSFTPGWTAGIAFVLIGTGFVVLLAYRHVEYANELWWQSELSAHAPRSLRALLGGAILLSVFALARLLRPAPPGLEPGAADVERALPIVRASPCSNAFLALLGDKRLLFHEGGAGFVMYGVAGRSWIALGDPIGPPEVRRELAWRFHEEADRHGGFTAFYEVGAEDLPRSATSTAPISRALRSRWSGARGGSWRSPTCSRATRARSSRWT
ncbi:MAG: phosphatidylglycerol lysyltransferase domain-containing protein [Myxococcota bacterium]